MYLHEATKFPDIFKGLHWSKYSYRESLDEMIANRNHFTEEFNVVKQIKIRRSREPKYDHIEFYQDKFDNYIVIVSPYTDERYCIDDLLRLAFIEIDKLYHPKAKTFMIKFKNIEDVSYLNLKLKR